MKELNCTPENFLFMEHTPDLRSKLAFYEETFDMVNFDWNGNSLVNPKWTRLNPEQVDEMMEA
jgi:hypothetical protein